MTDYDTVMDNLWLLLFDCEPRLIAGHRLPGLEIDPGVSRRVAARAPRWRGWLCAAHHRSGAPPVRVDVRPPGPGEGGRRPPRPGDRLGPGGVEPAVLAGFLVNRNITNSDNYRYLVFLLVPWSSGFGLLFARWAAGGGSRGGSRWCWRSRSPGLMTVDASRYYARLGWVDATGWRPVRVVPTDPALDWLKLTPR